jgi:ATP-binding cassette subfamily E protein 1
LFSRYSCLEPLELQPQNQGLQDSRGGGKRSRKRMASRIAIVEATKCKPLKCKQECKRACPVEKIGKLCIDVTPASKLAQISETLCIGCAICVKKCPFEAISIINLPSYLTDADTTHRFGPNAFKLHRLPMPRPGSVLGLVGTNGIGKSTALRILAGKLQPNLGNFDVLPDWPDILIHFRGSELQNFFTKFRANNLRAVIKPQYVDHIHKAVRGQVGPILQAKCSRDNLEQITQKLDLVHLSDRAVNRLSGGELQRFAIAMTCVQTANVYMFDEPSSYLDIGQRLRAAAVIRSMAELETYVVCVEHDLSVLDYLSDFVCCLYGIPGAFGVVTLPFSVREGINIFLAGFVPTENVRFRDVELTFKIVENVQDETSPLGQEQHYPAISMTAKLLCCSVKTEPARRLSFGSWLAS